MPVKYFLKSPSKIDFTAITKLNQGAGSGLDSDLVDGLHASAFEQIANKGVASGYASLNASSLVVQNPASKGQVNGLAELDSGGKVPSSQLPALALTDVWTVASEAEQLALTAQEGDVAIRTDQNKSYAHNGGTAGTMADWSLLLTPTDAVLSVFGRTGAVVAQEGDYTLDQLGDVAIITPTAGQGLRYNGTSWMNAQFAHGDLSGIGTNTHAQIDSHLGAASPHSGHELIASKNIANGYPGLSAGLKIAGTQITYGSLINTACEGNDSRLSDARTPIGTAGGDLANTYPNPTVALLAITDAKVAIANKDGLAGTPCLRTLGTGAQQACAGNDSRLSDARTPLSHADTHNRGGSDITLASRLYSGLDASKPGTGNTEGDTWWATDTDKLYVWDGTAWKDIIGSGGGATTFLGLTDTPSAYTGQGGKLVRVNAGATALEFLNELDKLLLSSQLTVGASAHDNNYMVKFEGTSATWGGLFYIKDTRTDPGGQRVLTFHNNVGGTDAEIYRVDNLGAMWLSRYLEWGTTDAAKYGRMTTPGVDGFLGLEARGTDANISLELRPKGTGVVRLGGASGLEVDTSGYVLTPNIKTSSRLRKDTSAYAFEDRFIKDLTGIIGWTTIRTIAPSTITSVWVRGLVSMKVPGFTTNVGSGIRFSKWYFAIDNATPTVGVIGTDETSGTAPQCQLVLSGNNIQVQVRSNDATNTLEGTAIVEILCPRDWGTAATYTIS